jgi:hypothetical protein
LVKQCGFAAKPVTDSPPREQSSCAFGDWFQHRASAMADRVLAKSPPEIGILGEKIFIGILDRC